LPEDLVADGVEPEGRALALRGVPRGPRARPPSRGPLASRPGTGRAAADRRRCAPRPGHRERRLRLAVCGADVHDAGCLARAPVDEFHTQQNRRC